MLKTAAISAQNEFTYFLTTGFPYISYQVSSQLAFRFRKSIIGFKMAAMAAILDFKSERI